MKIVDSSLERAISMSLTFSGRSEIKRVINAEILMLKKHESKTQKFCSAQALSDRRESIQSSKENLNQFGL